MKVRYKLIFGGLFLFISLLTLAHCRYDFFPEKGDGWSIAVNTLDNPFQEDRLMKSRMYSFEWLNAYTNEKTRFLADPFLFIEDNIYYIFFEHQAEGNANIGLMKSTDGNNYKYMGNVLDEDFHLSFPQVFKYNCEYYMVPETKQANNIFLYKAFDFPNEWGIEDTLIKNKKLNDPAILLSDTLNLISARDDDLKQTLYSSDSLLGEWKKENRFLNRFGDETRAGGNFFTVNGEWFIPFQKTTRGYGSAISIYKLELKENKIKFKKYIDSYLDRVDSIKWFNRGMHHISVLPYKNKFEVVFDGDTKKMPRETTVNWKASIKYNFYDLRKLIFE